MAVIATQLGKMRVDMEKKTATDQIENSCTPEFLFPIFFFFILLIFIEFISPPHLLAVTYYDVIGCAVTEGSR